MTITKAFILATFFALASSAIHAEGGCPQGQYPQEGPGWRTCVPGPRSNSNAAVAQPTPQWKDSWGALAVTADGQLNGEASNKASESSAVEAAIRDCEAYGGKGCHMANTYRNQCIAVAAGDNGSKIRFGQSEDDALADAMQACSSSGYTECHQYHSKCSTPQRIN
nr:DUF4189 domain-containing protein [Luteibacter yeojuensis]